MKLATWNVNSVTARLPLIIKWLKGECPDVLCLQETKCADAKFPREAFADLGYASETFGQPTYNGVATLARATFAEVRRGFPDNSGDASARLLATTVKDVQIVNVYVPNGGFVGADKYYFKLEWIERLRALFDRNYNEGGLAILCGDFNVAPEDIDVHDPKLWRGHILFSEPERAALERLKEWGFIDAFRLHHKGGRLYSWWDYRAGSFRRNAGLRIDHIWVSRPLAERSTAARIDKQTRGWERPSDHAPVIAEFDLNDR